MAVYKNVASQKIAVYAHDTAADEPKTGDAANISAQISLDGGATAATNDAAPTELDAIDAPGIYLFDLTQAETNADLIILCAKSSTADIQLEPVIIYTLPGTNAGVSSDAVKLGGQTVSASAGVTVGAYVGNATAAIAVDGSGYVTYSNTAPPSAATVASQVRTELSIELARIDAAISTRSTYAGADTAGTTTLLSRILGTLDTGTHKPQSGDAYSYLEANLGFNGYNLTNIGDERLENLDAAISSRHPNGAAVAKSPATIDWEADVTSKPVIGTSNFTPTIDTVFLHESYMTYISRLDAAVSTRQATVANLANVVAMAAQFSTMVILNGAVYEFTSAALAAAPGGGNVTVGDFAAEAKLELQNSAAAAITAADLATEEKQDDIIDAIANLDWTARALLSGTVGAVTSNSDFTLVSDDLSATDDQYKNCWLVFETGNNIGVARFIGAYTGAAKRVQFNGGGTGRGAFPSNVVAGDQWRLLPTTDLVAGIMGVRAS